MEKSPATLPHSAVQERRRSEQTETYKIQVKLSVNVPVDLGERLRTLAFEHRLSESSIVQVALRLFFARGDDALLGVLLKELGATLRRK